MGVQRLRALCLRLCKRVHSCVQNELRLLGILGSPYTAIWIKPHNSGQSTTSDNASRKMRPLAHACRERAVIITYAPRHWIFIRRIANKEVDYDRSNTVKTLALWRNLASPEWREQCVRLVVG